MPSLTKRFEIKVTVIFKKKLGTSMLKQNDDYPGRPRAISSVNFFFFVSCQIDVVNKQLFLQLVEITLYEITLCQKQSFTI